MLSLKAIEPLGIPVLHRGAAPSRCSAGVNFSWGQWRRSRGASCSVVPAQERITKLQVMSDFMRGESEIWGVEQQAESPPELTTSDGELDDERRESGATTTSAQDGSSKPRRRKQVKWRPIEEGEIGTPPHLDTRYSTWKWTPGWNLEPLVRYFEGDPERDPSELPVSIYRNVPYFAWNRLLKLMCIHQRCEATINMLGWLETHRMCESFDVMYSIIIHGLGKHGNLEGAFSLATQFQRDYGSMSAIIYNALIGACCHHDDYERGLRVLEEMRSIGLHTDALNYSKVLKACIKAKVELPVILDVYSKMDADSVEVDGKLYNDLIYACAQTGGADEGLRFLSKMRKAGFNCEAKAFIGLMEALGPLGRTREVEVLFDEIKATCGAPKLRAYTALLSAYVKKGLLEKAGALVRTMKEQNVKLDAYCYGVLLDSYTRAGELQKAKSVVLEMEADNVQPNAFMYSRLMAILRDSGHWISVVSLLRKMSSANIPPNRHVFNIIIDTFAKRGQAGRAEEMISKMITEGIKPDVVSWNSLVLAHCKAGQFKEVQRVRSRMLNEGCSPNIMTYNIIIHAMGAAKRWDLLELLLEEMDGCKLVADEITYTTLVDIYAQSGRHRDALDWVERMKEQGMQPTTSVYCALANAYARQGMSEQAVVLFQRMEDDSIEPNLLMLNTLLNSFAVTGKCEEASQVLAYMKENGLSPDIVTYTTFMKALVRAGQLHQVQKVFEEMQMAGLTPDRKAKDMLRSARKFQARAESGLEETMSEDVLSEENELMSFEPFSGEE